MAGTPKRRARREAAKSPIPDAIEDATAGAHNTRGRPRTRTRAGVPDRPGPSARAYADGRSAAQLEDLNNTFGAAQSISIERLRPLWCAGWLENTTLDMKDLAELKEYIAEEWGGQHYLVGALALDGTILQEHAFRIAGRPRTEGRLVNRAEWQGDPEPPAPPAPPQGQPPDMLGFLSLVLKESREGRLAVVDAMRESQKTGSQQVKEMLLNMAASRDDAKGTPFVEQLKNFADGAKALDKIRENIAVGQEAGEPVESLKDHATKEFMTIMVKEFGAQWSEKRAKRGTQAQPAGAGGAKRAHGPIPDAN